MDAAQAIDPKQRMIVSRIKLAQARGQYAALRTVLRSSPLVEDLGKIAKMREILSARKPYNAKRGETLEMIKKLDALEVDHRSCILLAEAEIKRGMGSVKKAEGKISKLRMIASVLGIQTAMGVLGGVVGGAIGILCSFGRSLVVYATAALGAVAGLAAGRYASIMSTMGGKYHACKTADEDHGGMVGDIFAILLESERVLGASKKKLFKEARALLY